MAVAAYSQQNVVFSYGGGAPASQIMHATYDGTTLNIYCTDDSPATANLVSAFAQNGANVTLTLPSSVSVSIDAEVFAGFIGQLVQRYYAPNYSKGFMPSRALGIAMARLGLANTAAFLANL